MMRINFFYGPDKSAFNPYGVAADTSATPFHGIISRGLLNTLKEINPDGIPWYQYAHFLEKGLENPNDLSIEVTQLIGYARQNHVLSFMQSAQVAHTYLKDFYKHSNSDDHEWEVWFIKEGHTSSVWKCSLIESSSSTISDEFILNVGRDDIAAQELRKTSLQMQKIAMLCPDINMAKVQDIRRVTFDYYGESIKTTVVKNEWISQAYEIHPVKTDVFEESYVLVERFITDDEYPGRIKSVRGRRFTFEECQKISSDIRNFLAKASESANSVHINISEGDVVWNGSNAIIIAVS